MKNLRSFFLPLLIVTVLGGGELLAQEQIITVADIYKKGIFDPRTLNARPMQRGDFFTVLENGNAIVKYSFKTGERIETILDTSQSELGGISAYSLSADETHILLTTAAERYFPRGTSAQYYIWDSKTNTIKPVSRNGKQRLATLSPDGSKVAFVRDNNLYIKHLTEDREEEITNDGKYNAIINGAADYVYYEFNLAPAFAWSPDSTKLAYYRFDEREVPQVNMTLFRELYPENVTYKFPKPGEKNAVVQLYVYNLKTETGRRLDVGENKDQYIPRIKWLPDSSQLCITRMNRRQNLLELMLANPITGKTTQFFSEVNKYWIDIHDNLTFLPDKRNFLWTSEQDGFNHIYLYNLQGKLVRQITRGPWEVRSFLGYDPITKKIFYTSSEGSPLQQHLYAVRLDGSKKRKLSSRPGTNRAVFSRNYEFYINTHSDAATPPSITVHDISGKLIKILEDNSRLRLLARNYEFTRKEFFSFTTSDGVLLNAWILKPADFDPAIRYPVLMYEYGGPGSQTVTDAWDRNLAWYQLLTQKGYIVVSVDGRGSGGRGQEFKKITYLNLGKYEPQDQIEGARYLSTLNYVDSTRIGIYGGSYGGYMAALCLLKGADVFKAGIVSKPVTHWKYYDTIYTERYMRTPQDNPEGYRESAPLTYCDRLSGKMLLLHGTADDNVHVQHTMMFAQALVEADKQFVMHLYTNKNHGYNHNRTGNTRFNLHQKITNFILENL